MQTILKRTRELVLISVCTGLVACSTVESVIPDRRPDYKVSTTSERLEVPPDLTSSTIDDTLIVPEINPSATAKYSDYRSERDVQGVTAAPAMATNANIKLERDGERQWLVVQGTSAQVWPKVRDFWLNNGFLLTMEDPRIGIMQTGWSENRADIPQGPVRSVIGKALDFVYSASTRDSFRVRLEQGAAAGSTEVYLTHKGMEEVMQGTPDSDQSTVWRPRDTDPELEAEMLKRLMVHMGVEEQRAATMTARRSSEPQKPGAQMIRDDNGQAVLALEDDFPRAWRRTGIALDQVGFAVIDRDRSKGLYYVRYHDPMEGEKKGFLSKLAFWNKDTKPVDRQRYQVQVRSVGVGSGSQVIINDEQGSRDSSATAQRILSLLHEKLS